MGNKLAVLLVRRPCWQTRKKTAMSNRYARILAAGGAAVLAATLAATPALAATTWTIKPGGAMTATSGKTTFKDTTTGTVLTCASSTASGTLKSGSGLPGAGIGSVTAAAYHCPTPSFSAKLMPRGLPWRLNLTSYDRDTGVARGMISGLQLALSYVSCSAVLNGSSGAASDGVVAVSYSSQADTLTILRAGGTLHWYHVSGCLGLIKDGDPVTLSATYTVTPKQAITSP
jgi:hypothetical protein